MGGGGGVGGGRLGPPRALPRRSTPRGHLDWSRAHLDLACLVQTRCRPSRSMRRRACLATYTDCLPAYQHHLSAVPCRAAVCGPGGPAVEPRWRGAAPGGAARASDAAGRGQGSRRRCGRRLRCSRPPALCGGGRGLSRGAARSCPRAERGGGGGGAGGGADCGTCNRGSRCSRGRRSGAGAGGCWCCARRTWLAAAGLRAARHSLHAHRLGGRRAAGAGECGGVCGRHPAVLGLSTRVC